MTFEELRLSKPLLRAVSEQGYSVPTPIQTQAIPPILAGRDLLGSAQTGTGKTAAFALPLLQRLSAEGGVKARPGRPRALIVAPTRELAAQIFDNLVVYGRHLPLRHVVVYGGVGQEPQVRGIRRGVDVLVATPGRLLDLIQQRVIDLGSTEVFILDEADQMFDMGFIHDIRRLVKMLPARRQTLMFSATMPPEIRELAEVVLTDPVNVRANPVSSAAPRIEQTMYRAERAERTALLRALLLGPAFGRTLVFTRTKHGADRVVRDLVRGGIRAQAIHGNKSQSMRRKAMDAFRSKAPPVLVATDIAARGIDVDDITHVINFDLPDVPETYVHRIGRTARAGAAGSAVSFVGREDRSQLRAIERLIGGPIQAGAPLDVPHDAAPAAPSDNVSAASRADGPRDGEETRGRRPGRAPSMSSGSGGKHPRGGRKATRDPVAGSFRSEGGRNESRRGSGVSRSRAESGSGRMATEGRSGGGARPSPRVRKEHRKGRGRRPAAAAS
jgi:ATP-dependent RNA helicase RhlE